MKKLAIPLLAGTAVFLLIIGLSEVVFGDLTEQDSYKPLWVILPILTLVGLYLYKSFTKKD